MMLRLILIGLSITGLWAQQPAPAAAAPPAPKPYVIQNGDVLDVRFFFNPELNEQNVQVRPDGCISLQIAGDVQLAGKTVEQARKDIEAIFAKEVKTARVSIQIRTFGAEKVYVSGEVPRPGLISLTSPLNLLAAISDAGGITKLGDRNRVVLIRKTPEGTPARLEVKLFAAGKPTPQAMMPLQAFDVVLVPESKIARADRWVDQWIRQLIPANLNAGFQYLYQTQSPVPIVPF
jgi:protein involved in polysaccharide export with SLBB domain